jgi:Lar family restriction alleviation protein
MAADLEGLRACPFCGRQPDSYPEGFQLGSTDQRVYRVECPFCIVYGPERDDHRQSLAAWNARAKSVGTTATLALCPFCGGPGQAAHYGDPSADPDDELADHPTFFVRCETCGAKGPTADAAARAVDGWNRRTFRSHRAGAP